MREARKALSLLPARPIDRNFNARRGDVRGIGARSGHALAVRERKFVTGKLAAGKERVTMAARPTMTRWAKKFMPQSLCVTWRPSAREASLNRSMI